MNDVQLRRKQVWGLVSPCLPRSWYFLRDSLQQGTLGLEDRQSSKCDSHVLGSSCFLPSEDDLKIELCFVRVSGKTGEYGRRKETGKVQLKGKADSFGLVC